MEKKSIKTEQYYGEPSEVGDEENVLCFLEHTKYLEPRISLCAMADMRILESNIHLTFSI